MSTEYGKKFMVYRRWSIYYNGTTYYGFLPGCSPRSFDAPEWEDDSLNALKEFIDCY